MFLLGIICAYLWVGGVVARVARIVEVHTIETEEKNRDRYDLKPMPTPLGIAIVFWPAVLVIGFIMTSAANAYHMIKALGR